MIFYCRRQLYSKIEKYTLNRNKFCTNFAIWWIIYRPYFALFSHGSHSPAYQPTFKLEVKFGTTLF